MPETDSTLSHIWKSSTTEIAIKSASPNSPSGKPGFVWLGGFKSDMTGTKAQAMVEEASALGCSSLRFDYSGHGTSGGKFEEGTISRWVDESLLVLREKTTGPQILVGSSMGGWIALRVAQELQKIGSRVAGLLLIAPAPDFTSTLMEPAFSPQQVALLKSQGYFEEPTPYSDEPNIITRALIEDGHTNSVLTSNLRVGAPVRILQGTDDPDVPATHAERLLEALIHDDVVLTLVKHGDHRLSRDEDIALLKKTMGNLIDDITKTTP